jgi:hypothetical protein
VLPIRHVVRRSFSLPCKMIEMIQCKVPLLLPTGWTALWRGMSSSLGGFRPPYAKNADKRLFVSRVFKRPESRKPGDDARNATSAISPLRSLDKASKAFLVSFELLSPHVSNRMWT